MLGIAVGVFAWLAVQSHNEAGLGRTANASPPAMRTIPADKIKQLAKIQPPPYEASAAEKAVPSPEFRAAMQHYQQGDYAGAVPGLRAATETQPPSVAARFYLALCLLLTNDRPGGIQLLKDVTAAGNTPFLESARFYLAQALLGDHNVYGADLQLRIIVEMHGKLEKEAQSLHAQIVPSP